MGNPLRVMQIMGHMSGGGVEATIMNHYRHIDRKRVQFDFVVDADSTVVPQQEIEGLGGRIFIVPPYRRLHEYCNACESIFSEQKPQIVHSNLNALSVFPLAAAKKAHVPVRIAHSHSTSNPQERVKTLAKNVLRPFSTVEPTHLAACGDYSARWLFGNSRVDKGDVKIIRNAINLNQFVNDGSCREICRETIGAKPEQLVIGQIGRMSSQKNQQYSLKILAELLSLEPDALLVFLGIGEDMERNKAYAKELGVEKSVKFMGIRNDAYRWYSAFDVVLMPSLYEGLPLVAVEAQAAGVRVITSTMVSPEACLIPDLVTRFDLRDDVGNWVQAVLTSSRQRVDNSELNGYSHVIASQGYEISGSALNLMQWYESIAK